jgi:hypothetical protein
MQRFVEHLNEPLPLAYTLPNWLIRKSNVRLFLATKLFTMRPLRIEAYGIQVAP